MWGGTNEPKNLLLVPFGLHTQLHQYAEKINPDILHTQVGEWRLFAYIECDEPYLMATKRNFKKHLQKITKAFLQNPPPMPEVPEEALHQLQTRGIEPEGCFSRIQSGMEDFLQNGFKKNHRPSNGKTNGALKVGKGFSRASNGDARNIQNAQIRKWKQKEDFDLLEENVESGFVSTTRIQGVKKFSRNGVVFPAQEADWAPPAKRDEIQKFVCVLQKILLQKQGR